MTVSSTKRIERRAAAIGVAVKRARARRGWSLRELARQAKPNVSVSTLSRLEDPKRSESPRVETLEVLAVALDCPLYELLGERAVVEYHGFGDWPETLQQVLKKRGGDVTAAERAFLEYQITLHENAALALDDPTKSAAAKDAADWEYQLEVFQVAPLWRTVDDLITHQHLLDPDAQTGLERVVRALISARQAVQQAQQATPPKRRKKTKRNKSPRRTRKSKGK